MPTLIVALGAYQVVGVWDSHLSFVRLPEQSNPPTPEILNATVENIGRQPFIDISNEGDVVGQQFKDTGGWIEQVYNWKQSQKNDAEFFHSAIHFAERSQRNTTWRPLRFFFALFAWNNLNLYAAAGFWNFGATLFLDARS